MKFMYFTIAHKRSSSLKFGWIRVIGVAIFAGCSIGLNTLTSAEEGKRSSIRNYQIESSFQLGPTNLRVLLPDTYDQAISYQVLYVLPVVAGGVRKHGNGLREMMMYEYHNTHQLICVAPEFTSMPWYADHSSHRGKRDESHLLEAVLPFIDQEFAIRKDKQGRLLIGFSKSSWGALTLLLRNPDIFYRAAAWDAGIRVDTGPIEADDRANRIEENFGSRSNFKAHRLSNLVGKRNLVWEDDARLFYYNTEGKRAAGGSELHRLMIASGLPHRYFYEPKIKHRWDTGWIPRAVAFLAQ